MSDLKVQDNMVKEVTETFSKHLNERLSSPLIVSFIISWMLWNYKFIVILMSGNTVSDTFKLIEQLAYPNVLQSNFITWFGQTAGSILVSFIMLFILPLLSGLVYIYLYPKPALIIHQQVWNNNKRLYEAKKKSDDSTVLTFAEAEVLIEQNRLFAQESRELLNKNFILSKKIDSLLAEFDHERQENRETIKEISNFSKLSEMILAAMYVSSGTFVLGDKSNLANDPEVYEVLTDLLNTGYVQRPDQNESIYKLTDKGFSFMQEKLRL